MRFDLLSCVDLRVDFGAPGATIRPCNNTPQSASASACAGSSDTGRGRRADCRRHGGAASCGVRRGIEKGDYVYRHGDLLFGPGDPPAGIAIDEQSPVFTMAYAKNAGIWSRKTNESVDAEPGDEKPDRLSEMNEDGSAWDRGAKPVGGHPIGETPGSFAAEGMLGEALVRIWEQARARGVEAIGVLTVRMFEVGDAFRLLGAVGAVSGAEKTVTITGGYETREGGSFQLEFRGGRFGSSLSRSCAMPVPETWKRVSS